MCQGAIWTAIFAASGCLIGDFETAQVSGAQLQAAIALTRSLMQRFRIPPERVTLHGKTPGEKTSCPGRNFPSGSFMQALSNA